MLRFYYTEKILKQNILNLVYIYQRGSIQTLFYKDHRLVLKKYNYSMHLSHPKRQQFFFLTNLKTGLHSSHSIGTLFKDRLIGMKFYKRSLRIISPFVFFLKKVFFRGTKKFYYIYVTNFNYRQYIFLQKFCNTVQPLINLLSIAKGYYLKKKYRRRIKRSVFHLIKRQ